MISRVLGLFRRYANRHAQMQKPGFPLRDSRGKCLGHIDRIVIRDDRLQVEGWALSGLVGLAHGDQVVERAPSLVRDDVLMHLGDVGFKTPGFVLDMPLSLDHTVFWAEGDGIRYVQPLPPTTVRDLRNMRRVTITRNCAGVTSRRASVARPTSPKPPIAL